MLIHLRFDSALPKHTVSFSCAGLTDIFKMAPQKSSAHEVFTIFENGGGYPTQALSFFVGLIGTVFAMFGKRAAIPES